VTWRPISEVRQYWVKGLTPQESIVLIRRDYVRRHGLEHKLLELHDEEDRYEECEVVVA
jgi:hypothetical protein